MDFRRAIRNTFSYLRPDGVFRCVQPDLRALVAQYHDSQEKDAAITFMRSSHLGRESRVRGLLAFMREWMGNSSHLWMWDWNALSAELCEAGFRNVRRAVAGDSEDPRFKEVEDLERWENSLGVECSR
jgi:predicted SAM-dependent methyltransferase